MATEIKINQETAETVYIHHPKSSYGIFCFNSVGDLFLNSDWGFYGFAWRSFGKDFKAFLASTNPDYVVGKFEINYREINSGKALPKHRKENVTVLVECFINALKAESNNPANAGL